MRILMRINILATLFIPLLVISCATQQVATAFHQRGMASWYGRHFQKHRTASGEIFDMNKLTAAHRTLPFGTMVRVRCVRSSREVLVRINDRGPFAGGRILDLSYGAARALGMLERGEEEVEIFQN
jgi:rare lipoprotein A